MRMAYQKGLWVAKTPKNNKSAITKVTKCFNFGRREGRKDKKTKGQKVEKSKGRKVERSEVGEGCG